MDLLPKLTLCSGTVDECNSHIGMATSLLSNEPGCEGIVERLQTVQHRLFDLGAHMATPRSEADADKAAKTTFNASAVQELETWIDEWDAALTRLTTFVLPGGHPAAAALHVARTVARRAERNATILRESVDQAAFAFLNRLSDFLFVAARTVNMRCETGDVLWRKRAL